MSCAVRKGGNYYAAGDRKKRRTENRCRRQPDKKTLRLLEECEMICGII